MSVLITATARAQYLGTIRRYLAAKPRKPARPQAAHRLIDSYGEAVEEISGEPRTRFSHPRPYPELAEYGFRWIKIHRYWFDYLPGADPIITNILDEVADIPTHLSVDRTPIDAA